jgi:hypothetical protein
MGAQALRKNGMISPTPKSKQSKKLYAVRHKSEIPSDGIGVVQVDDVELMVRLAEQAMDKKSPFVISEEDRRFFLRLAEAAIDYFDERCEAAEVRYA